MWKHRQLELRYLCDLGRWLMDDPLAVKMLGDDWRKQAFEACASPTEWSEFAKTHRRSSL